MRYRILDWPLWVMMLCIAATAGCKALEDFARGGTTPQEVGGDTPTGTVADGSSNENPPAGSQQDGPIHQNLDRSITSEVETELGAFWAGVRTPTETAIQGPEAGIAKDMRARLALLDAAKQEGKIGETNMGKVAFVNPPTALDAALLVVLKQENDDRAKYYQILVDRHGFDLQMVANLSGIELLKKVKPGEWKKIGSSWVQNNVTSLGQ